MVLDSIEFEIVVTMYKYVSDKSLV